MDLYCIGLKYNSYSSVTYDKQRKEFSLVRISPYSEKQMMERPPELDDIKYIKNVKEN